MEKESNNLAWKNAVNSFMSGLQTLKRKADIELIKDKRALEITGKLNDMRGEMTSAQWATFIYTVMKELDLSNVYKNGYLNLRVLREGLENADASHIKVEFEKELEHVNQKIEDYEEAVGKD